MKILVVIPTQKEYELFLDACRARGEQMQEAIIGRMPVVRLPAWGVTLARGGLGKAQFAVHTQHLLDSEPGWGLVICAGAAGGLAPALAVGDVVAATETVEHDIRNHFGVPLRPRFQADRAALGALRALAAAGALPLRFGPVASGDEDVIAVSRQEEIRRTTGAIAVAWEGAGGARACEFSDVPFIEIRGVSDDANHDAPNAYFENLPGVMQRVAAAVLLLAQKFS